MTELKIVITGLDKIQAGLNKLPAEIRRNLSAASTEVGEEILNTEGLRRYPPQRAYSGYPRYIRGVGMAYSDGSNSYTSERLGTQFYVKGEDFVTTIGNRASYARYVVGEFQARHMAPLGWRKLIDVAREKLPQIARIYQGWIDRAIRMLGLE